MKLRHLFLFVLLMTYASSRATAQVVTPANTFVVTAKAGTPEADQASAAVQAADFSDYRLRTAHRTLTFTNGVVIELLSATELKVIGYNIDPSFYPESTPAGYIDPQYTVNENGYLIVIYQHAPTK
ncbi:MAG: hypothetical protein HY064_08290 [Bacteroidetes bacterium]|nr:hypothetical protein [Bacteroidota bacterium]